MEFKQIVSEIEKLQDEIDEKFGRKSTKLFFFVDLIEEVGELAEVVRAKEFYKKEPKEHLEAEIVDIFYDLVGIARRYNVDIEKAIKERIEELKKRFL